MINTCQLTFLRTKRPIIKALTTNFHPGKVHVILGANGAGKSTLLQLLAGELTPHQGDIRLDQIPLSHFSLTALAHIRAVLPQTTSLNFPLRVQDMVAMGAYPFPQLSPKIMTALVARCLSLTETQHLAHRSYLTLSSGEQQRTHLARVLVQILAPHEITHSRFLFLDEPTAHLDPYYQHQVLCLARQLAETHHLGIIIVLHDVNLAAQYADHILLLDKGKMIAHGPSCEVLTENNLEQVYQLRPTIVAHPLRSTQPLILF